MGNLTGEDMSRSRAKKLVVIASMLLLLLSQSAFAANKKKQIDGVKYEELSQTYYSLSKSWIISIYLSKENYSRENLIRIWRNYCKKYPNKKKYVLDMRVYTQKNSFEVSDAMIIRQGVAGIPIPGENELMIYRPDMSKPHETKREVLAGRDPLPW